MKQFNPEEYKIFECITGSRLYGTNTPDSDFDYRGVVIPPMNILLDPFMGFDQKDSGFEEEDRCLYALAKFMKLCTDSNPNLVEILFVPDSNILFKNEKWDNLISHRDLFLSKKAKFTFTGFGFSQLNDIKRHRQWFIDPPKEKPTRKMFSLTDSPKISGEGLQAVSNINFDYFNESFRDEIKRELEYRNAKQSWDNYISWFNNRNPKRKELEEKYGYDCKHAHHLFRLMTEGKELLLTGKITFPLPNKDELLEIKNGKYSYDEVIELAESFDKQMDMWYNESTLPHSADKKRLTDLYFKMIGIDNN
jgi:uncharacterized protein